MTQKCQICKEEEAIWAWQPFGPSENPDSYILLGSHHRGFPVIKVGSICRSAFQTGDFPVRFTYKGFHYIGENHQVREEGITLWIGDTYNTAELNPDAAVTLMRDTPDNGSEVAALVYADQQDILHQLSVAPALYEACQELDALRNKIGYYLERGVRDSHIPDDTYNLIMMALAKVHVAMEEEKHE